jgi:hypothetical protein
MTSSVSLVRWPPSWQIRVMRVVSTLLQKTYSNNGSFKLPLAMKMRTLPTPCATIPSSNSSSTGCPKLAGFDSRLACAAIRFTSVSAASRLNRGSTSCPAHRCATAVWTKRAIGLVTPSPKTDPFRFGETRPIACPVHVAVARRRAEQEVDPRFSRLAALTLVNQMVANRLGIKTGADSSSDFAPKMIGDDRHTEAWDE